MAKLLVLITVFVLLHITSPAIQNNTSKPSLNAVKNRRKAETRSTSSESGDPKDDKGDSGRKSESLELSITGSESRNKDKSYIPKSSNERTGWRKWHRKCTPCPEARLKWRDPSIKWICGQYQRARRTFKSLCMMHYRNCQDGTMFVKMQDHRCPNDTANAKLDIVRGDHFFYEYKAWLKEDSTDDSSETSGPVEDTDTSYS